MAVQPPYRQHVNLVVAGFEWDEGNQAKCLKHGVALATIEYLLRGPLAVFPDPAHSAAEERFKAIGRTEDGRAALIVFTLRKRRGGTFIRAVSARYMHRKEIEHYEKATAEAERRQGS